MTTTRKTFAIACLMLGAAQAHAVPLTFAFTGDVYSYGYGYPGGSEPMPVPANFADFDWVFGAAVGGRFTLETDTPSLPSYQMLNGVRTETGSFYSNSVRELALDIGDQHFDFLNPLAVGSL